MPEEKDLNINVPVDRVIHNKLRKALFPQTYSDWLRGAERNALLGMIKHPRRKTRAGSPE